MKFLIVVVALFLSRSMFAQPVLVPYRNGDKFGLSDEKGKLVVPPAYDHIDYLEGNYFQYTNYKPSKDTARTYTGRVLGGGRTHPVHGLFYKDKLIIREQPFDHFLIYDHCIVGSENEYHPEKCTLYNLKGEQLLTEPIKGMGVNDERDFGNLVTLTDKLTLLSIFQVDEQRTRLFSIAVYDNEKQKITTWLLKKVRNFKADKYSMGYDHILCTYDDDKGHQEKYLRFINHKFELKAKSELSPKETADIRNEGIYLGNDVAVPEQEAPTMSVTNISAEEAPKDPRDLSEEEQDRQGYLYYQLLKDSLFYNKPGKLTWIKIPGDVNLIYINKKATIQKESIIYKKDKKFGLIVKGLFSDAVYDSLVYFGNNFIAGSKLNGIFKWGLLNKQGAETVPFIYDSIQGSMKQLGIDYNRTYNNNKMFFVLTAKEKDTYPYPEKNSYVLQATDNILVYKNGKAGIVTHNNEIIIPVEYDLVAESGTNFSQPLQNDFIVLKKNGLYGVTKLRYNATLKRYEMKNTIDPSFKYIPCYYRDNFYNKPGFTLYGLYTDEFKFAGYVNENGYSYFKD